MRPHLGSTMWPTFILRYPLSTRRAPLGPGTHSVMFTRLSKTGPRSICSPFLPSTNQPTQNPSNMVIVSKADTQEKRILQIAKKTNTNTHTHTHTHVLPPAGEGTTLRPSIRREAHRSASIPDPYRF